MKVTTLNLAGYKRWTEREANVIAYLDESQSDIVFIQEVKFDDRFSPYSQSKHLNSRLHTPYPYAQACISRIYQTSDGKDSREGLAVLSKYPIIDSETLVLTKQPDDKHTRIIQKVSLRLHNEVVTFVNVHFSNNRYSLGQLDETLRLVKNSGERSVILGDFNIFELGTVKHLYEPEYTASTEVADYISFPSENATFDYALVPHEYKLTSLTVGENLSDHNALSFELEIK
ncbi:Endonuclease/Exonuclease/phosphatase family protein [compost metagenome]